MKKKAILFGLLLILLIKPISQVFADTITVTGTVAARPSDFQLAILSSPPSATTVNQNQTITYTITYGSSLAYATPMTIKASWTQGTIQSQSSPSVDIADYVLNSASNAYGNTLPVVNPTNKTITWSITSFPGNTTNQTVTFQLKTNASYTGASTVTFTTIAHMDDSNVTIPDQSTNTTYQYNPGTTPTNTPTPKPTLAAPSPTSVILSPAENLQFKEISITSISANTATIHISTNKSTTLFFAYGLALHNLNKTLTAIDFSQAHDISLDNLSADTTYYFRITATDKGGEKLPSDYFSFRTASAANNPTIDRNTLIVTSENVILYNTLLNKDNALRESIIVPTNTIYNFQFSLSHPETLKRLRTTIVNKYVLGINTFSEILPNTDSITLWEIRPGVYAGRLLSPNTTGVYTLSVTVYDINGNITPQQILDVWVKKPIHIFSEKTNQPIEKAKVSLSLFSEIDHQYKTISPQTLPIKNPNYSNAEGLLATILPQGKYKMTVTALFYRSKTIAFMISPENSIQYPQVYLSDDQFNLLTFIQYYTDTGNDFLRATEQYLSDLSQSWRFFDLISGLAILCMVFITAFSLSIRTKISLLSFPWLFVYSVNHLLFFNKDRNTISGQIFDEKTQRPIKNALIIIIDANSNKIIDKVYTNIFGYFYSPCNHCLNFKFAVHKKGYEVHEFFEYSSESLTMGKIILEIKPEEHYHSIFKNISDGIINSIDYFFEVFLIISLLLELLFWLTLGWKRALPFLLLTLFNLTLWILHLWRGRK